MSYKDQRKEMGLPAGSVAPLNSTIDGSKWHHNVEGASLAKLTRLSTEINEVFDKGLRDHVRMQISIGRLLNDARELIPGDRQFGQWREANTPINNKSSANKLMNLARQVGEGRITQTMIDGLPLSSLKELLTAPESVLGEVTERLEAGETPTRDDIRQTAAEAKNGSEPDGPPGDTSASDDRQGDPDDDAAPEGSGESRTPTPAPQTKGPTTPAGPPRITPASQIPVILAMTPVARIRHMDTDKPPYDGCKPEEWAWLVLGLDPNPAYYPASGVVECLYDLYVNAVYQQADEDALLHRLQRAKELATEMVEAGN